MGTRGVGAAIRWEWQRPPGDRSPDDRAQAGQPYLAVGGITAAAATMTVGGALASLAATLGVTVGTAPTQLTRSVGEQPRMPLTPRRAVDP